LDLCKEYAQEVISPTEVGIFEFGISAMWKDGKVVEKYDWGVRYEQIRFDALMVNFKKKWVRGFEFKSSRQDFMRDKKWPKYLDWCSTLTFVCPEGVIKKGELPKGVGLVHVKPGLYNAEWVRVHNPKSKPLAADRYLKVVTNMLMKAKFRKEAIF
jgi:hypothetical protein